MIFSQLNESKDLAQLRQIMAQNSDYNRYHRHGMTEQRLIVRDFLVDNLNVAADSIRFAFLVIPKDWSESEPPEAVVTALRNSGYELGFAAVEGSAPTMFVLPVQWLNQKPTTDTENAHELHIPS